MSAAQQGICAVVAFTLSTLAIDSAAQTIAFTSSDVAALGSPPGAVTSADFNDDGRLDLATANPNSSSISIVFSAAVASSTRVDYPVGAGPVAVQAVDINHDHAIDLLTANITANSVSILLNNGKGSFTARQDVAVGTGPSSLAIADVNRDGNIDLVTANSVANMISIRLGTGAGGFGSLRTFTTSPRPQAVLAVDFNRDGRLDLAVASRGSATVSIHLGSGDGLFAAATNVAVAAPASDLVSGDFNRDGRPDLAVATLSPSVSVLIGNGTGGFTRRTDLATGGVNFRIVASDLNGDARSDLAVLTDQSLISFFTGHGDGTFRDRLEIPVGSNVSGRDARALVAGDFNRDGKPDVAVGAGTAATAGRVVMLRNATAFRAAGTSFRPGGLASAEAAERLMTGDFNRDARLDLVTTASDPLGASVLTGRNYGTLGSKVDVLFSLGTSGVATGDFNRDGRLDLAGLSASSNALVSVVLGNGNGTFGTRRNFPVAPATVVTTGDFNNDGKADIIAAGDSSFSFLAGLGNGTFAPASLVECTQCVDPFDVVPVDVDADGNTDLAFVIEGSSLVIVRGRGDGTFHPFTQMGLPPDDARSLAVGDFNRDGKPDFAIVDTTFATLFVLLGRGDGTFGLRQQPLDPMPAGTIITTAVRAGDFNRDGRLDLAVALPVNADVPQRGAVEILNGRGDGTFFPVTRFSVGTNPVGMTTGDFNRDGKLDLAVGGPSVADNVIVLLNSPSVIVTAPNTAVEWSIGSVHRISWTHRLGAGAKFRIDVSRDGGVSYQTIAGAVIGTSATSGSFNWTVTGPATTAARIRVLSTRDGADADSSNINFTIASGPP